MAACSFKKDPNNGKSQIVLVQQKNELIKEKTIEEIIAGDDEDLVIQELSKNKSSNFKTPDGKSLLDLAIKYEKVKVITYLLLQGQSPFGISEESHSKLEYTESLKEILTKAQDDTILDVIRVYPAKSQLSFVPNIEARSLEKFDKRIIANQLGLRGCQKLVERLIDFKFFAKKNQNTGAYYGAFSGIEVQDAVRHIISETQCSDYKKKFSIDMISKWLGFEILSQYQNNFTSIDFSKFLISMGASSIDMNVPNSSRLSNFDASYVKINPVSLLMLKSVCFVDEGLFREWLDLIKKFNIKNDEEYIGAYLFPEDWINSQACAGDRINCLKNKENGQSLYYVYKILNPATGYSLDSFVTSFSNMNRYSSLTDGDAYSLKSEICGLRAEGRK